MLALVAALTVLTGCGHHAQVRPHEVVFACADANFYATGIAWSHWGDADAEGVGIGHQNDCKPYCAAGTVPHVRAERAAVPARDVREGTTRVLADRVAFTGTKPAAVPRAASETLPCSFLKLKP